MLPSIWKANINDIEYALSDTALLSEYALCYTDRFGLFELCEDKLAGESETVG
jgi:hypothetical protein